jgi:cell wall-associated NlpC family hydrolase
MPAGEGAAAGIVARARLAVGTRFRAQGRTLAEGLDCVGLAAFAFKVPRGDVPRGYAIRSGDRGALALHLARHGLVRVEGGPGAVGDLAVFVPGPGQVHLAILTGTSLIHADVSLRRVVERPLPAPWAVTELWRIEDGRRRA